MSNECRIKLEWVPEAYKDTTELSDKNLKKKPIASKFSSMLHGKSKTKTVYGRKNKG
ncbi:hypothetical protein SAMN05421821_103120 [Mucilaginibacter lappiensis]|uniref:Uncharacterized protein n=1 Tax=Mucilaginibacter lappiensis TaxID=354630 RepID=A0ABR6PKW9_9SPHI|nr:hypothetical protein [Mucilaginibacter lappiensis]MBB6108886.1 hypothetical protein [Mucilaginibacter lappiensis]SIQ66479.1 hypothetical protein SAMN05421821_103120 [Mucilaginibacter lappiensis]